LEYNALVGLIMDLFFGIKNNALLIKPHQYKRVPWIKSRTEKKLEFTSTQILAKRCAAIENTLHMT
jgi:hypothetical protein